MEDGRRALTAVDWSAPWLAPWRDEGQAVARAWQQEGGAPLHEALSRRAGPVRFVADGERPAGLAYEAFIASHGLVPTRPCLHDFFNGLGWLAFPAAKLKLNALHAAELARHGAGAPRGPVRDAITVLDENGALLDAPAPIWEALAAREWRRLFVELRPLWSEARLWLFGHALLEKLVQPRAGITAHVWHAPPGWRAEGTQAGDGTSNHTGADTGSAAVDAWLANQLSAERLAAKPFLPLPVLGVPGWWAGNENFSFYDDSLVFRPCRAPKAPYNKASAAFAST